VKIDYFLPGCPPSADAIWKFLSELIAGRAPRLGHGLMHDIRRRAVPWVPPTGAPRTCCVGARRVRRRARYGGLQRRRRSQRGLAWMVPVPARSGSREHRGTSKVSLPWSRERRVGLAPARRAREGGGLSVAPIRLRSASEMSRCRPRSTTSCGDDRREADTRDAHRGSGAWPSPAPPPTRGLARPAAAHGSGRGRQRARVGTRAPLR